MVPIFCLNRERAIRYMGTTHFEGSGHPFNSTAQVDVSVFKQTRDQSQNRQELLFIDRFTEYSELRGISFNSIYQKELNMCSALNAFIIACILQNLLSYTYKLFLFCLSYAFKIH